MKKSVKILAFVLSAVMLVVGSVFATYAYLTATTHITNTFVVGDISITLDETDTDEYGVALKDTAGNVIRTTAGNQYKLVPGATYVKDPTIHVKGGSEPCYLFAKVTNGIAPIEASDTANPSIHTQMGNLGWTLISDGVYYHQSVIDARDTATDKTVDVTIFESFTIGTGANTAAYKDSSIEVIAYAVQKDGFDNATAAWTATFGTTNSGTTDNGTSNG